MTLDSQFAAYHPVVFVDVEAHAGVARNKNHERPTMMKSMMVEISDRHGREPKDCPTGKSDAPRASHLSSPSAKKYSLFTSGKSNLRLAPSRLTQRGGSRSSGNAGRDAVDAGSALTNALIPRTAKSCGPDAPTLASSWRRCFASWPATVARKPGHRGERAISR